MGNRCQNHVGYFEMKPRFSLIKLTRRKQLFITVMSIFFCIAAGSISGQTQSQTTIEYRVKVAILRKLTNFVEWPEGLTSSHFSTLGICIVGSDAFSDHLYTLTGQTVRGKKVSVERLHNDHKLPSHCKIVFISRSEHDRLKPVLDNLNKEPVLTVSDQDGFAEKGGMVNLRVVKNKVRFEINVAVVNRAGLRISAKLLRLATLVESKP